MGEEEEKVKLLTLEFMSEESDPDDTGAMSVHQPEWSGALKVRKVCF